MELLQLKYFCRAAATESFAKTAEEFHVPPSAISQSIRRLETELGAPLFIRSANRVKLNPQGHLFFKGIQDALNLIQDTTRTFSETADSGTLRIGYRLSRQFVMQGIDLFRSQYPNVDVTHTRLWPHFNMTDFDVIISDDSLEHPEYSKELALRDKIYLIARKGMLPATNPISKDFLRDQTFLTHPVGSCMLQTTQDLCRLWGFTPKIITQTDDSVYFIPHCIEEGRGVVLAPRHTKWVTYILELLDVRDIGEIYRDTCIYCRLTNNSRHASRFRDLLMDVYKAEQTQQAAFINISDH